MKATEFLIVRHLRIGKDAFNPTVATVRLSADKEVGPHLDFVADAVTLDQISKALAEAAVEVRKRAS